MSTARVLVLTALAMVAFAGNGLLCRIALKTTPVDPATFTSARLLSGALVLAVLARIGRDGKAEGGSWVSAAALFAYAGFFSFAYRSLTAATGALLLFAAVQVTMIGRGLWTGERLGARRAFGLLLALGGLVGLLLPGLTAPPLAGSALMIAAGVAWGVYSLRGRGAGDPTGATAGNFLRSLPFALACSVATLGGARWSGTGVALAILSGAVTSGIGYAIWYTALPFLAATNAAIVQLCVPVLVALGGIVFLGEAMTVRFVLASVATLGGIALVILGRRARA